MKKHVTSLLLLACLLCMCFSFSKSVPLEMLKTFSSLKNKQGKNTTQSASRVQLETDSTMIDYKIQVYNATASSFQPGSGEIMFSFDGNMNTLYHSNWSGGGFPITLTYNFRDASQLDYIIYHPRLTGVSGKFGETEIWYATAANPGIYTKVLDYDFQFTDTARRVNFPTALQDVASVRIIVKTGRNNFASCAEMEFYSKVPPPVRNVYIAGNTGDVEDNKIPVQVIGGTTDNFQPGGEINFSFDNDFSTIYHSNWSGGGFPITLTYQLANTDSLDLMEYYPRVVGDNGNFGELEILYSTQNAPDQFTSLGNYDFNKSSQASSITFSPALVNPSKIKVIVKSGKNNFASCAEIKFYKKRDANIPDVFTDNTCSELKPGVTQATIDNMTNAFYKNMAQHLLNNTYQKEYRVQDYQVYPLVEKTAAALKTSTYNSFENPTGIVFQKDENIVVFVSDLMVKPLQLKVVDVASGSMQTSTYLLNKGINKITVRNSGLGYIGYYYDDHWQGLPDVKVNIAGGTVNGYFDASKHTNADWVKLLREAEYGSIDIVGRNVSLCYSVFALREYTPDDVSSFIDLYDAIVYTQYEQMGLVKYNRIPKNKMYAVTTPTGGWRAGGLGAMFALDWGVGNVTGITGMRNHNNLWGIAHEFGHVNQIRPGLRWIGTADVTNNIFSLWASHLFGNGHTRYRLETDTVNDGYNNHVAGGRMNEFLNYGIIKGELWQLQSGGNLFVTLTPLWQLMMYYQLAGEGNSWYKPDWYADVAEIVRNTDERGLSNGQLQLNFMKNTCDVVGEDLTDFFKKIGMLKPIDRAIGDYSIGQVTITQAECDELVAYAAKYPKPASPVIYYLNMNSIDAYKKRKAIAGTTGVGVTLNGDQLTIDHQQWKNVAAFETYDENTLLRAAIYGTGSTDNSFSKIQLPVSNAKVYAVGWDGCKKLVYSAEDPSASRNNQPALQVYPMPFKNSLNVKLTASARIKQVNFIHTVMGTSTSAVFNQQGDLIEIQGGSLLPGVYLLQLIDDKDAIQAQKVIKQ